ncbi:hypothetical protein [Devosia sp. YR412]|nr:hypothetical protein [Devosia sp. YR412]
MLVSLVAGFTRNPALLAGKLHVREQGFNGLDGCFPGALAADMRMLQS